MCSYCKAQTIVPLDADEEQSTSTYFKDTNMDMDKFVGTWVFNDGSGKILTITLQKKLMVPFDNHFEDLLIGEYKYEINGYTVVNTLPLLNDTNIVGLEHKISGREIYPNNMFVPCPSCSPTEKRFTLSFEDPLRPYLMAAINLRYLIGVTPEKLQATIYQQDAVILPNDYSLSQPRVPFGEYVLTKQ